MEHQNDIPIPSCPSGIPRTRSQASPQWATQHVLILVNEIAAIESDCSNALSSFQKWKLIVQNCNALGVPHSSNQCRRKWNLLLQDYKKIKRWASASHSVLSDYWSLGVQRRKEFGLPEDFDNDLFKAIKDVVGLLDDKSGTDHDSDPEAQDDMPQVNADLGSKKQRRKLMPLRNQAEMKSYKRSAVEKPKKIHVVEQPHESCVLEKLGRSKAEEITWRVEAEENLEKDYEKMKRMFSAGEEKQIMVARLGENAEQIQGIVEETLTESADLGPADLKNVDDLRTDFVRRKADNLIACLGDILSTLNQFSELGKEYE